MLRCSDTIHQDRTNTTTAMFLWHVNKLAVVSLSLRTPFQPASEQYLKNGLGRRGVTSRILTLVYLWWWPGHLFVVRLYTSCEGLGCSKMRGGWLLGVKGHVLLGGNGVGSLLVCSGRAQAPWDRATCEWSDKCAFGPLARRVWVVFWIVRVFGVDRPIVMGHSCQVHSVF